jgi:Cd2+/Zn2+-exporting ATPase
MTELAQDSAQTGTPQSPGAPEELDLILTGLTILGLAVASFSAFLVPLPSWVVTASLLGAYLAGGVPAGLQALSELFGKFRLDIDLLMVVAALAAAAVGGALEGAVLLALFSLSGMLEHRAMGKARRAVEALMALRADTALKLVPGGTEEVAVATLKPGDRVILRPGARVPVDGTLVEGYGEIDESTITGESVPVAKEAGAKLHEATVNLNAVLTMQVARSLEHSTVARMIALVTEAQGMKAPSERFSDWFGQRYTVAVLVGSVLAYGVMLALGVPGQQALYRAATLLVAASPCAVVISVPAAILSALSAAARGGVLFKGGAALERLAEVKTFAFDKTGTLTTGRAEVTGVVALAGDEASFLALFAGIEAHSEHPIAGALRREVTRRGHEPVPVTEVQAAPSEGIMGRDDVGSLWAGNPRMVARMGAVLDHADLVQMAGTTQTVVYLGREAQMIGAISVADQPRETSRAAIAALRASGVDQIVMMTGDRRPVALRIADHLGISAAEVHADLLPQGQGHPCGQAGQTRQGRLRRGRCERRRSARPRRCRYRDGGCRLGSGAASRRRGPLVRGYGASGRRPPPCPPHHAHHPPEPDLRHRRHAGPGDEWPLLRPAAAPGGGGPRRRHASGRAERPAPAGRPDPHSLNPQPCPLRQ